MTRLTRTSFTLLALAALVLPAPRAEATPQNTEGELRVYSSRFLGSSTALSLAFQVCGGQVAERESGGQHCQLERLDDESFSVRAPAGVHERFAALLAERDVPPATQSFRVILLRAHRGDGTPELPEGARAALEDLRAVLPFSGFDLIDSTLLRTSLRATTQFGDFGSFVADIAFQGDPRHDPSLHVEFGLDHTPILGVRAAEEPGMAPQVARGDRRQLMATSFEVGVGETMIVGTSRLNGGNEALVVLLTALER